MIQADDIAAFMLTRWNGASLATLVPGGLWNGRPDENAAVPYATFTVKRGETQYTNASELPHWLVEMAVFVDQDSPLTPHTGSVQAQEVQIAVGGAYPLLPTTPLRAGSVIHMEPRDFAASTEYPMRSVRDVVNCRFAWDIWCQGSLP